jgi:multisubunit Na+/H+ antiporter MnhF subunit
VNGYTICTLALLAGGLLPALALASKGDAVDRLVGVELISGVTVIAMLLISQVVEEAYNLIVPLVLVPLSVAGTLVFTRLIEKPDDGS